MRYIAIALSAFIIFSCSNNDEMDTSSNYFKHMAGRYTLKEIYTDTPIDINFDGIFQVNMMQEIDCQIFYPLDLYEANINYSVRSNRVSLMFEVPNSQLYSDVEPFNQCFVQGSLLYHSIEVNKENGNFSSSDVADHESEYGRMTNGHYENRKLYLDVDKIIFTSEGWQTLPMHFVYEWHNP